MTGTANDTLNGTVDSRVDSPLKGFIGLWPMTVNSALKGITFYPEGSPLYGTINFH